MTVINMMGFGGSGAAVADEQSSGGIRKYNVAQKLKMLNGSVVYGGSGAADFIREVYDEVNKRLHDKKRKHKTPELVYEITKQVLANLKNSKKDKYLQDHFGITLEELQTGMKRGKPLDDSFKKSAFENLMNNQGSGYVDAGILLGAVCDERFEIFYTDTQGHGHKISRPYVSIGSGADESDKVLAKYVTGLPREQREKIQVEEGLVKLIEATNGAANLNVGVGGSPSIIYLKKEGDKDMVKQPNENQCILASEVVEGYTRGLLDRDFVYSAVVKLILENVDFRIVEEDMRKKATDWAKLDRILRGYKE